MKFKFAFETLLKHFKHAKEERQRDYHQAKLAVDKVLDRINQMYQSLDRTRQEIQQIQQIQNGKEVEIGRIRQREEYIDGLKVKIEADREIARELMMVAEEKLQFLLEAVKELKSLEKLKERKYQKYHKEMKKKELKNVDEMVIVRHKRRALG